MTYLYPRMRSVAASFAENNISGLLSQPLKRLCPGSSQHEHLRHDGPTYQCPQRRWAGTKARAEKKSQRALLRARRERERMMASVVKGEDWSNAFGGAALKQGLKELDAPANNKRTSKYASKPLMSKTAENTERETTEGLVKQKFMTQQEAWARDIQYTWNEFFHADSISGSPVASLPGFPLEVVKVVASRDMGHIKVYWEVADHADPPPEIAKQIREMVKVGYDLELVVLKTIAQTLRKRQGYLRTQLALRYPMKRVPDITWEHASQLELGRKW